MYADVVETVSVTLAPSGRPLAAFANGTIAFTSKVSGVPDILLTLAGPSGSSKHNLGSLVELPVFHPCVRLSRWKEHPGELSFVPPDGRFILAGYEVDLLPFSNGKSGSLASNNLKLPVSLDVKTGLGPTGSDFEVRLSINRIFGGIGAGSAPGRGGGSSGAGRGFGGPHPGTPASPSLEDVVVKIPLPADVRNLSEVRPSKGDANYNPGDRSLSWHIPSKEIAAGTSHFGLRCTAVGPLAAGSGEEDAATSDPMGFAFSSAEAYSYDEPYQAGSKQQPKAQPPAGAGADEEKDKRVIAQNKTMLMPTSASVSFAVKGWLASGIRVESITLDSRKSRGLGEAVKPYKGVKYLTVSKGGVEIRC
jgi:hypothetical protein